MDRLGFPLELKFAGDHAIGSFEGYASIYGVIDGGGDSIAPGAFTHTLAARKAAGAMEASVVTKQSIVACFVLP